MKILLAVRHVPFEDLGSFGPLLAKAGYHVRYAEAVTADFAALAKERCDLVVVLGGPIGVNDGADFPFITPELKFVEARLKTDAPTLGICLGSQFMAKALGVNVRRMDSVEIGWSALQLTDAGRASPLKHLTSPVFHWHGETYDLPAGAQSLASTNLTPCQGFSWGKATLALQFHPEVTGLGLDQWYVGNSSELKELGLKPSDLRRDAQAYGERMQGEGGALLTEWLESLP